MQQRETWIDFKELRQALKFHEVLERYNVKLNIKGNRATGFG
jgi:hypothetical protein